MKFAFVTCVELGFSCIKEIYNIGEKIDTIITLKDKKAINKSGRVYLDQYCMKKKIQLFKVENINEILCENILMNGNFDWIFIIGWSQIANEKILKIPKNGIIGAHPTLLPEGRGRASIPWAILKGLKYTGVSFFKMNSGIDTGEIIHQEKILISKDENATTLYEKINSAHITGISKIIPRLKNMNYILLKQDKRKASYWPGRKPEDGEIDLKGSVIKAEKLIRATSRPYPGAFFIKGSKKIIIWKAKIIDNSKIFKKNILVFSDGVLLLEDVSEINLMKI